METVHEAVCISHSVNIIGNGMNQTIPQTLLSKQGADSAIGMAT